MPRQARKMSESGIYHAIVRGINKQAIFEDEQDSSFFLNALDHYKQVCGYQLLAYCLMGNHVHLVIQAGKESLDSIFRRLGGKYSYWYNNKYQRVGHLFQDRFLSEPVESDAYLLMAVRYVHQNPLVANMVRDIGDYPLSSYNDYLATSNDEMLTDTGLILSMLGKEEFVRYHTEVTDDKCLEIPDKRFALTDDEARQFILQVTGCKASTDTQKLDPEVRNRAIFELKSQGLSVRQLSRLTGLSKSTIERH